MPHWRVEQDLRASSLAWTFLRPSFFAQNLGAAYRAAIRDRDRDRLASGLGRTSFIDTRDGEADDERAIGRRRARADRADHHAQAEHELVV
jgi:uncharacterized protein YbjT (DUF2867 family)